MALPTALVFCCLCSWAQEPKIPSLRQAPTESQLALDVYAEATRTWDARTQSGELPEAERLLQESLEADPDFAWAHVALSALLRADFRAEEAGEHAPRAVELAPASRAAHAELAAVRLALDDPTGAIEACRAGLGIASPAAAEPYPFPGVAELHRLLAEAAREAGNLALARNQADQAAAAGTDWPWTHLTQALISRDEGNTAEATAVLTQATERFPDWPVAFHWLGEFARESQDLEAARSWYERALAVASTFAHSGYELAEMLRRDGQVDEAIGLLQTVTRVRPHWPQPRVLAAQLLWDRGDYEGALVHRQASCELEPDDPWRFQTLAFTLRAVGRAEEAVAAGDRAAELAPERGFFTWCAAGNHRQVGDVEGAVRLYEEALALGDDDNIPVTEYARTSLWRLYHKELGQTDKAREVLLEGVLVNPEAGRLWCALGELHRETGEADEAVAAYRRAAQGTPHSQEALIGLLETLNEIHGDPEAAVAAFDEELIGLQAAGAMPAPLPQKARGHFLRGVGQPAEAAEAYARAVELDPDDDWARACLGHALVEAGQLAEAALQYEVLAAEGDRRLASEGHYMLACIHAQQGHTDQALEELRAAILLPTGGRADWLLNVVRRASQPEAQEAPAEQSWHWSQSGPNAIIDYDYGPALAITGLVPLRDDPRFREIIGEKAGEAER